MAALKFIDFKTEKSFEANGQEYFIENELSIERSVFADQCKIELETGVRPGKQLADWKKIYELANGQKFADIVILAYNNMNGINKFYEDIDPVIRLCCCYFNTKNEDRRSITTEIIEQKVKDFAAEGIAKSNFFVFALAQLKSEIENYANGMASLLEVIKKFQSQQTKLSTPITA